MRGLGRGSAALVIAAASAATLIAWRRRRGNGGRQAVGSVQEASRGITAHEGPLQAAARAVATVTTIEDAIHVLAQQAVVTTRAFGAYVERVKDPERSDGPDPSGRGKIVEVIAAAGRGCPPVGTEIPYPGSLTEEIIESGEPQLLTEIGAIGERMAPYLRESCRRCTGLVLPLSTGGLILGAMVLLRGPEQGAFSAPEVSEARSLADLATAALKRLTVIEDIEESGARFQQLADNLEEVIWLGAPDLSARYYVNAAYERIWRRPLRSFYEHPRSPIEAVHPEDRTGVDRALRELARGGVYDIEYRILRPDGEVRWIRSRGYPIRNDRGEVYRVAGIMEDITDRRAAEQEREELLRREQEARAEISMIIETITDAFITLDEGWRIVYANGAAERLLGRRRDDLIGRVVWEAIPEIVGSRFEAAYRQAMAEQRTISLEEYYDPIKRWLDLRVYPSANRLSIYFRDITDRKRVEADLRNRIEQLSALSSLSQYALAETDLDALFGRAVTVTAPGLGVEFVELLELIPDQGELLLRSGTGWREGLVGRARINASAGSMAGYTLLSDEPIIAADLRAEGRFHPSWLLAEHGAVSGISVVIRGRTHPWGALGAHTTHRRHFTDNDIFFLQSVSNILGQAIELRRAEAERMRLLEREREARAEAERSQAAAEESRAVAEESRIAAEESRAVAEESRAVAEESRIAAESDRAELQRIVESRARLMRGFSHDVKNPLGAADGFLQLMEEGILDELTERQREGVRKARRAIGEALELIGDLLTIARAEAGQLAVECRATDPRATIDAVVESFQARAATKGLSLRADLPESLPTIDSDPDRIRQVLGNLLSNAIKYTDEGEVRVSATVRESAGGVSSAETSSESSASEMSRPGRWIAVDVSDTGPGIPPEKLEIIFREFGRAEERGAGESQGIGLYISERIAQALGGTITVRSKVGEGSTFTLWLPVDPGAC